VLIIIMGIRFLCPTGHKLNVKAHLAGKRAICPECGAKVVVPEAPPEEAAPAAQAGEWGEIDAAPNFAGGSVPTSPFPAGPIPSSPISANPFTTSSTPSIAIALETPPQPQPSIAPPPVPGEIGGLPESILAAPTPTPAAPVAESPELSAEEQYQLRLERNRRNQILMAVFLFMLVIVLAGVLIWVLKREANSMNATPPPAEETEEKKSAAVERIDFESSAILPTRIAAL
jgi:hypothetical protein